MSEKKPGLDKKTIDFCRKNGISVLKTADFEVQLHPSALFPESAYHKKKNQDEAIVVEDQYSREDILNWSATGLEVTQ